MPRLLAAALQRFSTLMQPLSPGISKRCRDTTHQDHESCLPVYISSNSTVSVQKHLRDVIVWLPREYPLASRSRVMQVDAFGWNLEDGVLKTLDTCLTYLSRSDKKPLR